SPALPALVEAIEGGEGDSLMCINALDAVVMIFRSSSNAIEYLKEQASTVKVPVEAQRLGRQSNAQRASIRSFSSLRGPSQVAPPASHSRYLGRIGPV